MRMRLRFLQIQLLVILTVSSIAPTAGSAAFVGDGFDRVETHKSKYFTIYIKDNADMNRVGMALTVPAALRALIRIGDPGIAEQGFEGQADTLFLAISEILGIRLKSFSSSLKICRDAEGLEDVAQKLFGQRIKAGGFYVVAIDALYMDAQTISLYIFGHELAHAVISKYFVVPPPERIQEVLAGYVEYEMRKYTQALNPR